MVNVKALENISANRHCEDGSFHSSFPFFLPAVVTRARSIKTLSFQCCMAAQSKAEAPLNGSVDPVVGFATCNNS